ncbi:MAG: hypothetical protein GC139_03765 [Sideroxydans sp.]|nr:hypothetical protein [Sideroxydans sp.]
MKQISYSSTNPPGLLQKALAIVVTAALAVLGFMFSAVLLAIILIALVAGGAYMWWKTRKVRKQMRQMQEQVRDFQTRGTTSESTVFQGEIFEGEVIEGEAIRVGESRETRR